MTSSYAKQFGTEPINMDVQRPRLLVVDDQPVNIVSLYEIFHHDHEVFISTNGNQALEMCRSCAPDLILLDILMPDIDGLEVCRQLKADSETADIPIIFVTAQDNPDAETGGLNAGAVDFITKPVNPAVVRARVRTHLTLKTQSDLLRSLVFIDGLTGVANRRRFDESLDAEWRRCRRISSPLSLFMVDLDHFKLFNDSYGHQAGDACLQKVAETLKRQLGRSHDLVARYGGEEFVCLLPDIHLVNALQKAEAMVRAVRDQSLPHCSSTTDSVVTISLGVAVIVPGPNLVPADLVSAADAQLYAAKHQGRNRVCARELS